MGITDKHTYMEEAVNWPAEVHFHKINHRRMRRGQSPSRDVSPVPSYFSEPVSIQKRKDVTSRLPHLIKSTHQDEDDDDDIQSLKSLPTLMNTLTSDPKVNRSRTFRRGQSIPDFSLPLLVTSKCTLVVKGTGCTYTGGFLPAIKSTVPERPPCRAGCRPDKDKMGPTRCPHPVGQPQYVPLSESHLPEKTWNIKSSCQRPSPSSSKVSLGPRITFQSPVVQDIYPITPALMKGSRQDAQACQPLRGVLKKAQVLNRGALHCLLEKSYLPCSKDSHLLEPFSGFEEHLCHQLLNSPFPCGAALPHANSHHLLQLEAMLPVTQGLNSSLMQRTVELCNPQRKQLPSITMTRPTPSPNHLHSTENRHVA
ncbi:uncharacterized protein si:dkey-39a18.1 [Silurus meridionalis]|uniref:Uncharacterized protein n=1 Tax=Silurus meridionalis TaxID=175797 RepID=A0A8T0ASC1_SILME|nr:uncharacterized protein si:dkey-39a18.1 [Silurus meridionalis]XP_046729209.1 uncharacterized protein si:dkey-39a18.1 [Silurus meridionalis]KAF7693948.1 hypothetical protein HF521_007701 [Silurus meridionalis]